MRRYSVLAAFVLLCLAVGAVGGFATAPAIPGWYAALAKPRFNPPSWLFAPVWTFLYVAMAIAAWLLWRTTAGAVRTRALTLWTIQLVLNACWTPVFFTLHGIGAALGVILLLDLTLVALVATAWRLSRPAAWLLVPYLAWTLFATLLNAAIMRLN